MNQSFTSFFWRGFRHAAFSLFALVLAATFIGIGSLCHEAGFSLLWAVLGTIFIWAGPAHVILVAGLTAGAPWLSIALSVTLSSVRLLPMVVSLMPYLRKPKPSPFLLIWAGQGLAISGWVEGMRVLPHMQERERLPFFLGLVSMLMLSAVIATVAGHSMAGAIPFAFRAGLLFLTPMFFLLSLMSGFGKKLDTMAMIGGFFVLLLLAPLSTTLDLLFAGLGGGTLAYGLSKIGKRT